MPTETPTPKPTATPTEASTETTTPEPTATSQASGGAMLAAPILVPGPAPALAPLATSLPTTHRVITYTYPSTVPSLRSGLRLRTGDSLYRLTAAEHSTGEFYQYAYDAMGNRLSLVTSNGSTSYEYDAANRLVLSSYCAESKGEIEVLTIENS